MPAQRPWQLGGQVLEGALTGRRDDGGGPARRAGVIWFLSGRLAVAGSSSELGSLRSARPGEHSPAAVGARSPAGVFSQLPPCRRYWVLKAVPTRSAWEWCGTARCWQTRGGLTSRPRAQVSRELQVCRRFSAQHHLPSSYTLAK